MRGMDDVSEEMSVSIVLLLMMGLFVVAAGSFWAFKKAREQERQLELPPGYGAPGGGYTPVGRQLNMDVPGGANLLNLQLNDIVSHFGTDYIIEGRLDYWDDGDTWVTYRLVDGNNEVWLAVEQDDDLDVSLWREVKDLHLPSPLPEFLEYRGQRLRMVERGEARVNQQGKVARKTGVNLKYYEYEGDDNAMLSVEDWGGGDVEVFWGEEINPAGLDILPGDKVDY
jgi:hypothetical protein